MKLVLFSNITMRIKYHFAMFGIRDGNFGHADENEPHVG